LFFCIIIDLFVAYKYPICNVFHWFCKIVIFFATEPINENLGKVVVATAGLLSALATGNVLPLGGPAIAFLDLIRGNK
jgi:hypothetical protein